MSEQLDQLNRELADIQRKLIDLPRDAFAERYELEKRRDGLRKQASEFHTDWDQQRSDADLLTELRALRGQLKSIDRNRINTASQVGGNPGTGAGDGGKGAIDINNAMRNAQGTAQVEARVARIVAVLEERGVKIV